MSKLSKILFFLAPILSWSQSDTLFLQKVKIPLTKTRAHFQTLQRNKVILPSEYTPLKKELQFECLLATREYVFGWDESGNEFQVTLASDLNCSNDTAIETFYNVADTIQLVQTSETPYIKSNGKKIYLCYATICRLRSDTLTKASFEQDTRGINLEYKMEERGFSYKQNTIYILTDIYYRKQMTTFFLDRTFVIKVDSR